MALETSILTENKILEILRKKYGFGRRYKNRTINTRFIKYI